MNGKPWRLHDWKLINDLGISAFLTIITTTGTIGILVWLGAHGQVDDALKLAAPLILMTYKFWDGYLSKRDKDEDRRNNGAKPLPPTSTP